MALTVVQTDIVTVVALSQQVPELAEPYDAQVYQKRLHGVPHLILLAEKDGQPAGFKVGYQRDPDGSFYSWMGGVVPDFRRGGVAKALAERQEEWARAHGYRSLRFKTRNRHKAMLTFALNNGFYLISVEPWEDPNESRIWLEKLLIS